MDIPFQLSSRKEDAHKSPATHSAVVAPSRYSFLLRAFAAVNCFVSHLICSYKQTLSRKWSSTPHTLSRGAPKRRIFPAHLALTCPCLNSSWAAALVPGSHILEMEGMTRRGVMCRSQKLNDQRYSIDARKPLPVRSESTSLRTKIGYMKEQRLMRWGVG